MKVRNIPQDSFVWGVRVDLGDECEQICFFIFVKILIGITRRWLYIKKLFDQSDNTKKLCINFCNLKLKLNEKLEYVVLTVLICTYPIKNNRKVVKKLLIKNNF